MIKYEGHISYIEDLRGDFSARVLFGALKLKIKYTEDLDGGIYVFGFRIRTLEQISEAQADHEYDQTVSDAAKSPITLDCYQRPAEENDEDYIRYSHHLADIETLKRLGRAGLNAIKSTKNTLTDLIRISDSELRKLIVDVLKKIFRQLLPRRLYGDFKYGLDDPYYTAKILEIFAMFYAKVGDDLKVEPVWNGYCFLGSVGYEGRIHLSVILWNLFRLASSNSFRKIWREYNDK